jgi:hypothetical protein
MQDLLPRFLFISGLAALGITFAEDKSYGISVISNINIRVSSVGTATLNLSRSIAVDCIFTSPNYFNSSGVVNLSGSLAESITWEGVIGITCNHGGNVQISAASPSVSSTITTVRSFPSYQGEYLSIGGSKIWKNGNYTANNSVTLAPSLSIPYQAVLSVTPNTSGLGLSNGNYTYTFTLTATPN